MIDLAAHFDPDPYKPSTPMTHAATSHSGTYLYPDIQLATVLTKTVDKDYAIPAETLTFTLNL